MLHQAVDVNDVDRVRKLVSKASTEGRRRSSSISIASPPKALLSPSLMLNSIDPETGRTPLHIAIMRNRWPVIKALAECKLINLNVKELESGWTPAAYALYSGHLQTVVEMERLRPNEINYESIDNQGNTLLTMTMQTMKPIMRNTTVTNSTNDDDDDAETTADSMTEGSETEEIECSSSSLEGSLSGSELYTWGPNSNYNLCLRDGDDRTFPERVLTDVFIPEDCYSLHSLSSQQQYPVKIAFSKYHSAILTAGPGGRSLLMAGIGAGGRLGLGGQESQIVPRVLECPLDSKGERDEIVDVALGHDHSVLVTASGDVYTFGSNRYGQLGYSLRDDEQDCQMIPKRLNPLKRQKVIGCAASTVHSVVYTADGDVYVWGTNRGQMGCPVPQQQQQLKISPQKVNNLPLKQKCLQIVASDSVTACLMETHEVYALLHYGCYRIQFPLPPPTPRFPTSHVTRLCCNESGEVGAVDNYGNGHVLIVFKNDTFDSSCQQRFKIKSIKVSNNKNFNLKIRDLALVDSDRILICTIDSHLYTGQRNAKKNSRSGSRFYDLSPRIPMKPVKSVFAGPLGTLGALTRDDNRPGQFDSSCCLNFSQLIRDLYNNDSSLLLETDFFSDVLLLTADGQQLNAHQIILLSKCSRLKQLFDGSLTLSDFTNLRIQMPNIDRQRLEIQFPVDLSDLSNIVECIYLDRQLSNNTSSIIKEICDELGVTSVKLSIYQNAAKSDVVLLTGNGQLLCHKFILTLGSLFFRALLEKESYWSVREQQQINLGHLPRDIVQVLVDYLYGKSAVDVLGGVKGRDRNDLISKLLEIMSVANELLVDSLKSSCQHYISLLLGVENVLEVYEYSIVYAADALKGFCLNFICANLDYFLSQRSLCYLSNDALVQLDAHYRHKQSDAFPYTRIQLPRQLAEQRKQSLCRQLSGCSLESSQQRPSVSVPTSTRSVTISPVLQPDNHSQDDLIFQLDTSDNNTNANANAMSSSSSSSSLLVNTIDDEEQQPKQRKSWDAVPVSPALHLAFQSPPRFPSAASSSSSSAAAAAVKQSSSSSVPIKKLSQRERRQQQQQQKSPSPSLKPRPSPPDNPWKTPTKSFPIPSLPPAALSQTPGFPTLSSSLSSPPSTATRRNVVSTKSPVWTKVSLFDPVSSPSQSLSKSLPWGIITSSSTTNTNTTTTHTTITQNGHILSSSSLDNHATSKHYSSFAEIQAQQRAEAKLVKLKQRKRSLANIQIEELALKEIAEFYVASSSEHSGEYIHVQRVMFE